MATRQEKSYCRLCSGLCGMDISVDEHDHLLSVRGDKSHAMTKGYACIKGLQAPDIHYGESRLLHPLKRAADGSFQRIPIEQALDEISDRLVQILAVDEPRSVALYRGTNNYFNSPACALGPAWLGALGSPSFYSTATIDQSSKFVVDGRLGSWEAGRQPLDTCDVWIAAGYNPLVSVQNLMGFPALNPTKQLQELRRKGVKLIAIDPRRSETARYADIHLQIYPGEDVTVAAGLLNIILRERWHDADFCTAHVNGLDELARAVAPFSEGYVAQRAGVAAADLVAAASLFAKESRRGFVTTCTGPNMTLRANLAVQLYESINVVCGRFMRAGEPVANPGVLSPRRRLRAQALSPTRPWQNGPRSRVGDYHGFWGEMMTNTLADEILTPGPGGVRSLFVLGGNPASALPDQRKAEQALRALDLLVTVDPVMTNTAKLSHYILPPRVLYEREDMTNFMDTGIFPRPFAQYTPAIVLPPAGAEVIDDWYLLWATAKRLGVALQLNGETLGMTSPPSTRTLLDILARRSQVPLDDIVRHPAGKVFDVPPQLVAPADETAGRFELAPFEVIEELGAVAREHTHHGAYEEDGSVYSHRLSVRRLREVVNTCLQGSPSIARRVPYNTAQLHPDDLDSLCLNEGDRVELVGSQGRIPAVVEADPSIKPGVVSMTHGWGGLASEQLPYETAGANTNLLVSANRFIEPINAMARMTGIPVNIVAQTQSDEPVKPQPTR